MRDSVRAGALVGAALIAGSVLVVMHTPSEPPTAQQQPVTVSEALTLTAVTGTVTVQATAATETRNPPALPVLPPSPPRRPAVNPPDPNCTADDLDRALRYSKEEGYEYLAESNGCHTIHAWMKDAVAGVPNAGDVAVWLCTHDFNSPLVNANHRIEVDVREADLWADAVCLNFDYKSTHYMQCRPIFKSPTRQVLNFEDFPCTKETTLTLGETKTARAATP